jgi:hypothetical protein
MLIIFSQNQISSKLLTPKIPCVFLPNFVDFDIVGKNQFLKKQKYEN